MKPFKYLIFILVTIACNHISQKHSRKNLEIKAYDASESGNYASAIACYNELIKDDSLAGEYYFGRGYSYLKLVKIGEATKDFLKSIKLNYRTGASYYNLGLLNVFVDDSAASIYFKKAIELSPDNIKYQKKYRDCLDRLKANELNR